MIGRRDVSLFRYKWSLSSLNSIIFFKIHLHIAKSIGQCPFPPPRLIIGKNGSWDGTNPSTEADGLPERTTPNFAVEGAVADIWGGWSVVGARNRQFRKSSLVELNEVCGFSLKFFKVKKYSRLQRTVSRHAELFNSLHHPQMFFPTQTMLSVMPPPPPSLSSKKHDPVKIWARYQ